MPNEILLGSSPEYLISNKQVTLLPPASPGGLPLVWCYLQLSCLSGRHHYTFPSHLQRTVRRTEMGQAAGQLLTESALLKSGPEVC